MPAEFSQDKERPDVPLVSMVSVSKITSAPARASCWAIDTPITPPPTTATLIGEVLVMNESIRSPRFHRYLGPEDRS